ncbi:MAG: hypothetical protein H0U81_11020 [Pyrinomonadaceae bacterium]|jgi:hypothetical protein|nr:hypothetical protein [Pyrinomonadaceae bacterium]
MDELRPGDKIVELGAMLRSVTTATGAISSALLLLLSKQGAAICIAGFFLGAITGFVIGLLLSRVLYIYGERNVTIVKATPAGFPVILLAALKGAACQTLLVLTILGVAGKITSWPLAVLVAVSVNLIIALLVARLSLS